MENEEPANSSPSPDSEPQIALDVLPLHSTNLLTVLDESGIIQYESPSIQRIFGFEQDELVGEQVAGYFHPDDREDVVTAFRTVVTGDTSTVEAVEYRHEQADGTYKWVESVASANPTPDGNYVVNTRDISDQKAREQRLEATNERLDRFTSIVSHDLRNPLNIAQGRLELVAGDCESEHIDSIARAHDRIDEMIDDLLTLSRVGDEAPEMEMVALAPLAEACWHTVPTASASLVTDTDQYLLADRSRLRHLLENLVRNAVEHGGRSVTVTVGDLDTGFFVEDDGSGIPEPDRKDAVAAGYSTADDGTGFGLSIVEQVAAAHGWDIRVTEGTEGGARFEFSGVSVTET